jgi:hypothetical protein
MKIAFLIFSFSAILPVGLLRAQSKSATMHPFVQWEIRQIERIDSLGEAYIRQDNQKIPKQRDSVENWLEDSIQHLNANHRNDVLLKLEAFDTFYSDLLNLPLSGNWNSAEEELLDSVYILVLNQSSDVEKIALKKDQRRWLKKRDAYFEKADLQASLEGLEVEGGRSETADIIRNVKNAVFISKRVRFLANKIKS